jgi:hypothetical protein
MHEAGRNWGMGKCEEQLSFFFAVSRFLGGSVKENLLYYLSGKRKLRGMWGESLTKVQHKKIVQIS